MSWDTINANALVPKALVHAVSGLAGVLQGALEALQAKLDIATNLPSLPEVPSTTGVVVDALLDTLESLLAGGRIHILPIPIAKTPPRPTTPALPPTLQDMQDVLDISLGKTSTIAADAYASMVTKNGGNAGFYKAFAESLMDVNDPNRPQYEDQHDAVAMAVLLVGAASYASAVSAATTLELLVKPSGSAGSLTARTVPVPQGFSAKSVATAAKQGVGVRLSWDAPRDAYQAPYFPDVVITVKRYAVIRSTNASLMTTRTVLDVFPTQTLTEGMVNGDATVVVIGTGRNTAYLDTTAPTDVPVYYAVAWECESREAGVSHAIPFDKLSAVAKIEARVPTPPQTGSSPNWSASPSVLGIFPPLSKAATLLVEQARVLTPPSTNPVKRLASAVSRVHGVSARLTARSTELSHDIERLSDALSRTMPSLHVTRMSSASGGNAFLLSELATRLGDRTDPTRPPFDHGEYVLGVCFVAGASRLADLAAVNKFFDMLFGPADAANPLLGILGAIDTVITQAETVVFGQNMTPAPGVDPSTGLPAKPSLPVIADNGTAVSSLDPANPAAGETNKKTSSDLC